MELKNAIATQFLRGKGLELGPLNNPLSVNSERATVLYADRLAKADAIRLFPELESISDSLIDADILIDFDTDPLTEIKLQSFDFVIANHVIEHLVNPIQFLQNISVNLKSGGQLFLTVPDKDYTFDKRRELTSNEHLWKEYQAKVASLSNAHIKEFLQNKEPLDDVHPAIRQYFLSNGLPLSYYQGNKIPWNPIKRARLYDFHRQRSIHVHVWNRASFDVFFEEVNSELELGFRCLETHEPSQVHGEMIYLLERE